MTLEDAYERPCWESDVWLSERLTEPSVINASAIGVFVEVPEHHTSSSSSSSSSSTHFEDPEQILLFYGSSFIEVRQTKFPMRVVWNQQLFGEHTSHVIDAKKVNLGTKLDAVVLLTLDGSLFIIQWTNTDYGFTVREIRPFKHEDFSLVLTGVWDLRQPESGGEIVIVRSAVSEKVMLSVYRPLPIGDVEMIKPDGSKGPDYVTAEFGRTINLKGLTKKRSERLAMSGIIRGLSLFEGGLAVALCSPFNGTTICVLEAPSYSTITLLVDPANCPRSNSTPLSLMVSEDGRSVVGVCDMMILKVDKYRWSAHRVAIRGGESDKDASKRYDERCRLTEDEKDGRGSLIEDPPPPGSIVPSPQLLRFTKSLSVWGTTARRMTFRGMDNLRPTIVDSTPLPPVAPMRRPPLKGIDKDCLGMITSTTCLLPTHLNIDGDAVVLLSDPMGKLWFFPLGTRNQNPSATEKRQIVEVDCESDFVYPCPTRHLIPIGNAGYIICIGECGAPSQLLKIHHTDDRKGLRVHIALPWPPIPTDRPLLPAPIIRICELPRGLTDVNDDDTSFPCPPTEEHSTFTTAIALGGQYPSSCLSFIVLDSPSISLEVEVASIGPHPPREIFAMKVHRGTMILLAFENCTKAIFLAESPNQEEPSFSEMKNPVWLRQTDGTLLAVLGDNNELLVYEDG
ncbi:hypothetical protein FOL47_007249, partial [Perkinsus chesapeaki]